MRSGLPSLVNPPTTVTRSWPQAVTVPTKPAAELAPGDRLIGAFDGVVSTVVKAYPGDPWTQVLSETTDGRRTCVSILSTEQVEVSPVVPSLDEWEPVAPRFRKPGADEALRRYQQVAGTPEAAAAWAEVQAYQDAA